MIKHVSKGAFIALFFLSSTFANDDFVPPVASDSIGFCAASPITDDGLCTGFLAQIYSSIDLVNEQVCSILQAAAPHPAGCEPNITDSNDQFHTVSYKSYTTNRFAPDGKQLHRSVTHKIYFGPVGNPKCPDTHPFASDENQDGLIDKCFRQNPLNDQCPIGFFGRKIDNECVPIQCATNGISRSFYANASLYTNNPGTYCDGKCAYSVEGGQNNDGYTGSLLALSGVSTGEVCGKGRQNQDEFFQEGDSDQCTSQDTTAGNKYLVCANGNSVNPDATIEEPVNLEVAELQFSDIGELTPVSENCSAGDVACEVRNLKQQVNNENKELKEFDLKRHNQQIAAQEKSFNDLIKSLDNLQKLNTAGFSQLNTTIETGGVNGNGATDGGDGSGSAGSGGSNIDIGGAPTGEEVGTAFGGLDDTISHDVVNIQDYTGQYSGWLSGGGTCPDSKPVTLSLPGGTQTFEFTWKPVCQIFDFLGYLVLASSWFIVARMIGRSI